MDENEKKVQGLLDEVKALKLGAEETKKLEAKVNDLAVQLKEANKEELKKLDDALNLVNAEVKELKEIKENTKFTTLEGALTDLVESKGFKDLQAKGFKGGQTFELKMSTADIVTPISLSNVLPNIITKPDNALLILPIVPKGSIGANMNRLVWRSGAYASNVSYVGEGVRNSNPDTVSALEYTRELAKISAHFPFTTEMIEDTAYFASFAKQQLYDQSLQFLDDEMLSGDGLDGDAVKKKHVYGIKAAATDFDSTVVPVAKKVANPNLKDLVLAVKLQLKKANRMANTMFVSPEDMFMYTTTKDTTGNYIFLTDAAGNVSFQGLNVLESNKITANEMIILDLNKVMWFWKRTPELKIGQEATDLTDDQLTAVLFLRGQLLIADEDKDAIISVPDITAALTAITKA